MAGCHAVDGLRWLVRDEAVEVTAYSNTSRSNLLQYEYDPNVVIIIRFAGGAMGKVASLVECRMPYTFNVQLFGDTGHHPQQPDLHHRLAGADRMGHRADRSAGFRRCLPPSISKLKWTTSWSAS